jgi:hypothetical protein
VRRRTEVIHDERVVLLMAGSVSDLDVGLMIIAVDLDPVKDRANRPLLVKIEIIFLEVSVDD